MIRTAVFAAFAFAAATPALAIQLSSAPAPKATEHFSNRVMLAPMMSDGVSEPYRDHTAQTHGPMVVYVLPKGKPADRIDVTNPRDNPFLPQPERKPAPANLAQ